MKPVIIIVIAFVLLIPLTAFAQYMGNVGSGGETGSYTLEESLEPRIPQWVKNIFGWYAADQVSEDELLNAIKYLIYEKILLLEYTSEPIPEPEINQKSENNVYSPACVGCSIDDAREAANEMLLDAISISVWTDKTGYDHNDTIIVTGQVKDVSGFPVTLTVVSPLNNLVTQAQLTVEADGSFETTLSTAGAMWKYDGTYTIKVNYGSPEKSNSAKVELTD